MLRASTFILVTSSMTVMATSALADEDSRYPAHHFKPSVIYQDYELIAEKDSTSPRDNLSDTHQDPQYPGSAFTPRVIYQNPEFIKR